MRISDWSSDVCSSDLGWIGFTDKYWLTALIPGQNTQVDSGFRAANGRYQADLALPSSIVPAGKAVFTTSRLFAGAQELPVPARYQNELGITHSDTAIARGWLDRKSVV